LTLWNPTIHPVVQYVRIPANTNYTVRDPTGQMIVAEVRQKNNQTINLLRVIFSFFPFLKQQNAFQADQIKHNNKFSSKLIYQL
jgi:hypothetical protein